MQQLYLESGYSAAQVTIPQQDNTTGIVHLEVVERQSPTLIQAPALAQIIDKGILTAGLLAEVLVGKCANH